MSFMALTNLLACLILWVLLSFALLGLGKYLTRFNPAMPQLWWGLLAISFVPFLPFNMQQHYQALPVALYAVSEHAEQVKLQTELVARSSFSWDFSVVLAILMVIYIAVTAKKLMRFWHAHNVINDLLAMGEPTTFTQTNIQTVVLPVNCSPFVSGLWRSKIALPKCFVSLPQTHKNTLLYHEMTHSLYRDHHTLFVWQVLSCFCWFNPALYKMQAALVKAIESRCDQKTITRFALNKKTYAQAMLWVLKYCDCGNKQQTGVAFASTALSLEDYKQRLTNVMLPVKAKTGRICLGLILNALLLFVVSSQLRPMFTPSEPNWAPPLETYFISSHFGHISQFRNNKAHAGSDLVAPKGTFVSSVATGKVLVADSQTLPSNYGKVVLVQHSNGYQSLYAHLDQTFVNKGDWVTVGGHIGTVGETGKVTGPHLHLEILHKGKKINPLDVIKVN
ncbi:hypothetical protein PSECIP111951_00061 [Pseudoalteromonas holothuriae]|uniref:Peptidase M23 domain-containing protein n=1 Tax=Pseudoalteromonas holothuriae TaxID=2963714 RepID=A0ABM9GF73_9GAMM|nr:M23/M56 family metallopeptidase [Pseudoalteromonas sp. CIP111951]CAH9049872.1 hypothetical protein PSECIP111951_00061 [Pseudoalteromonas sp. CIP111951]